MEQIEELKEWKKSTWQLPSKPKNVKNRTILEVPIRDAITLLANLISHFGTNRKRLAAGDVKIFPTNVLMKGNEYALQKFVILVNSIHKQLVEDKKAGATTEMIEDREHGEPWEWDDRDA
ncbi:uncharacterized protein LOC119985760 [Tripterygium wilfordii]|uniref:uncharacterized protein LOC119985760 n=1 Tax=Tripterygium wilfordii TaxID=458696 RepID=UPI0018F84BE4|nr:uncharacterized protein LOC119985760 [Tripterygium wilfordii]XP_038686066.1 uncharacterized protein LOC119985760 [Tripterygium wilfordii]